MPLIKYNSWQAPGAETCRSLICVMNRILLSAYVGRCIKKLDKSCSAHGNKKHMLIVVLKKMSKSCSAHGNKKHMLVVVLKKMSKSCSAHGNKKHMLVDVLKKMMQVM
jgi:hypothetical protein